MKHQPVIDENHNIIESSAQDHIFQNTKHEEFLEDFQINQINSSARDWDKTCIRPSINRKY